jgi:hypothetical protein
MEYKKLYLYKDMRSLWEVLIKSHLVFKKIELTEQATIVLSYLCEKGISNATQKEIIKSGACPHRQAYYNCRTLLKDKKLIERVRQGEWKVSEPLASVKLDNPLDFAVRCKVIEA